MRQKDPVARDPIRVPTALFLSCPWRGFAPRNAVFESLGGRFQDLIFHESEIKCLDMEN
jgi:hypothetical protein